MIESVLIGFLSCCSSGTTFSSPLWASLFLKIILRILSVPPSSSFFLGFDLTSFSFVQSWQGGCSLLLKMGRPQSKMWRSRMKGTVKKKGASASRDRRWSSGRIVNFCENVLTQCHFTTFILFFTGAEVSTARPETPYGVGEPSLGGLT